MGNGKGKRKELSPQDAALLIQLTYRAHLARRSQVLRCLRELAVAKAKLKEIRSFFYNISYRHRIAHDHEERQKFSEKIIVLLLTVDALELIALILGHIWHSGNSQMRTRIELLLRQNKLTKEDVKDILQEYHDNIGDLEGPEEKERAQARTKEIISAL